MECRGDGILCAPVLAVGELERVQCGWQAGFEVSQDQPLEALLDDGGKCNWAEVIQARCSGVFWHRHDGGGFEANGDNCLG